MLRTIFRGYMQVITDKLVKNKKLQSSTKLKKIIHDAKVGAQESDIRIRIQPLKDLLENTIDQLHTVFETRVFIIICRGLWGSDGAGYKVVFGGEGRQHILILDDIFASEMQKFLGNALQEKDLEPPRSIADVRSMLCKDTEDDKVNNCYYSIKQLAQTFSHGSGVWRNIRAYWNNFESNVCSLWGCGRKIRFWEDAWLGHTPLKDLFHGIHSTSSKRRGTGLESFS